MIREAKHVRYLTDPNARMRKTDTYPDFITDLVVLRGDGVRLVLGLNGGRLSGRQF